MMLCIGNVLNADALAAVRDAVGTLKFDDGRKTAGWAARLVKNNEQAEPGKQLENVRQLIGDALSNNELFTLAARPKELTPIMISRYSGGEQRYGTHVDDALMRGMRSDLSFTLFLAEPDSYEGGELVIEQSAGDQAFKLEAGSMILYPTTTLHRGGARYPRHAHRSVRMGAQLHTKFGKARAPVRPGVRPPSAVRRARQNAYLRHAVEVQRQPVANVG